MKRVSAYLGAVATGLLGLSQTAQSELINVTIDAGVRTSNTEGQCLFPVPVFTSNDCSYNDSATYGELNWIGPGYTGAFYAVGTAPEEYVNTPAPGDGRIGAPLSGTITIDNKDAPAACDTHSISGVILMGPFSRNYQTQANVRLIDNYPNGIEQTIADRVVDAGTPNGAGGCDYVLGSAGAPNLLTTAGGDTFPGQEPHAFSTAGGAGTTDWQAPGTAGLTPGGTGVGEGNQGHTAVATEVGGLTDAGFTCFSATGVACTPGTLTWNTAARAGWDNIVGTISTDSGGNITGTQLFFVHQVTVVSPGNNSWMAYTANITGTGPGGGSPTAADDTAATDLPNAVIIDVLANDTGFADPVTVSVTTAPTQGTTSVTGSPGNQANITITYTPTGSDSYVDTFVYTVDDGTDTDTATVTITVTDASVDLLPVANAATIGTIATVGVSPDTTSGTVNVSTIAGNDLGDTPAVITATNGATGTTSVAGNVVTYTPAATFFTGTDTFDYTITDDDGDADTATVTVTIADASPTVADGSDTGDQDTTLNASGAFTAGNGSVAQHTLAVQTQAADGSCAASVSGANVAVAYTPDAGFFGTDSCVVRLTDGDGDFEDATFTFTVDEVVVVDDDDIVLPGGSSSLDLWSLTLLGALPLIRRRRRLD